MRRILGQRGRATRLKRGLRFVPQGRFDDAERELRNVLKRAPNDCEALLQLQRLRAARALALANALFAENRPDTALELLFAALEHAPTEPELHIRVAERLS